MSRFQEPPRSYPLPTSNALETDFNRDGSIQTVGAFRTLALLNNNGIGCKLFNLGETSLGNGGTVTGAPDLVRYTTGNAELLVAFAVKDGEITYRIANLGAAGNKSCTGPSDLSGDCLTFYPSNVVSHGAASNPQGLSAYVFDDSIFIAYHDENNDIFVRRLIVASPDALVPMQHWSISGASSATYVHADTTPELIQTHDGTSSPTLRVLYRDTNGTYRRARFNVASQQWDQVGFVLWDQNGVALSGTVSPAALNWPDDATTNWQDNELRTLLAVTDSAGRIRIYILSHTTGRWEHAHTLNHFTRAKPIFTYRTRRSTTGSVPNHYPGHFMIGGVGIASRSPFVRLSQIHSRWNAPSPTNFDELDGGMVGGWLAERAFRVTEDTATVLYSDSQLDNVFGLMPRNNGLFFLPHADGSVDRDVEVDSDFKVMETEICRTIAEHRTFIGCKPELP